MISIPLSFRMGTIVWENRHEKVWDHPVLHIGSSHSSVKGEVIAWLDEHCQGRWQFGFNYRTYEIRFELEDDAVLFSLRWL